MSFEYKICEYYNCVIFYKARFLNVEKKNTDFT